MRKLIGKTESITVEEASQMREEQETQFLAYLIELVENAVDDEEERSNVKVHLACLYGKCAAAIELDTILSGEEQYLNKAFGEFASEVKILEDV